jgi:hypothetical protein
MRNNVIDAATMSNRFFVIPGKWTLVLLLATQETRDIQTHAQEASPISSDS